MTSVEPLLTREEAAAKGFHGAMFDPVSVASDWVEEVTSALAAADAHDQANGIHRIALDDATVEMCIRVARGAEPSGGMYYREAEPIVRAILDALREAPDA